MYLLFDAALRFPLNSQGQPRLLPTLPPGVKVTTRARVSPEVTAVRVSDVTTAELATQVASAREWFDDPLIARAVGLVGAHERGAFDPADGSPLAWDPTGAFARGASGRPVFPRIDPCVIGVVEHNDGDRILLGENRRRPGYFTCIAGYVDVGERAEDAFAREVREETGRRIDNVAYVGSQPWPLSGSLMLGFFARTHDEDAAGETDGELRRIIWATREDLGQLPLAPEGSIARKLIGRWAAGEM